MPSGSNNSQRRQTACFAVNPAHPEAPIIERAARLIRDGGLVAFPTETVYGLGANALDEAALRSIYAAKERPASDPIIAHIARHEQLKTLASGIPEIALTLAGRFWPGPLTLVLRRAPSVPDCIAEGLDTVAVRMPAHPVARALLQAAGVPIGAPSANTFTRPSATTAAHVLEDLHGRIDMVLDGGPTTIGLESTVLDLSRDQPLVLRPGGIDLEDLRPFLPGIELSPAYLDRETASRAPGQMLKHYSPRARLLLFTGSNGAAVQREMQQHAARLAAKGQRPGLLLSIEEAATYTGEAACQRLGPEGDLHAMGQQLFAAMRALDAQAVDTILVRDYGRTGIGAALWDRMLRAAEGKVITVDPEK